MRAIESLFAGLGDDFQEDLLKSMAEAGKGNFYYIESPDGRGSRIRLKYGYLPSFSQEKATVILWGNEENESYI